MATLSQRLLDFGFENIDLWRSEEMQLVQLMIPAESAHDTISALGEVGLLQFKDLNADKSAFQRTYASQVKRCDEMARKLRFFHDQVEKAGLSAKGKSKPLHLHEKAYTFDELEGKLEELEKEVLEINSNMERLQRTQAEMMEMQVVLDKAGNFFDARTKFDILPETLGAGLEEGDSPLLEAVGLDKVSKVGFVAGTIQQDKVLSFERLLFRATRGNVYLRQASAGSVRDPASGEEVPKVVFVVFFAGERSQQKINKICEVYGANRYPFPDDVARQRQSLQEVTGRLRELQTTNEAGERRRDMVLKDIAANLEEWTIQVRREKAVYHTLNKLSVDYTSKVLIAEAWVPIYAKQQVQDVLAHCGNNSSTQLTSVLQPLATTAMPPTHFRTTPFTSCFQTIVDAYGIARYREVNPTVLTIMTFPFLFAVMFGDLGHAIILLLVAGLMIWKEKALLKVDLGDMLSLLFGGRYCMLLMGIYSVYTGLLYNEFFSMPMAIFGDTTFKCWQPRQGPEADAAKYPGWAPKGFDIRNCGHWGGEVLQPHEGHNVYVFGIDPIWHGRKTELQFFNSFKMKMSIILGVLHMDFGILNSLFNNLYFRDTLSTLWEFIPQIIFLNFIFGYLCILIISKWCNGALTDLYRVMIDMFLSPGTITQGPSMTPGQPASWLDLTKGSFMFNGQSGLQVFLLLISFIAVPCMLLPKPLLLKKRHEALARKRGTAIELSGGSFDHEEGQALAPGDSTSSGHGHANGHDDHHGGHGGHGEHFDFGEIMVHQMIHTIEFVLGAVSNTASYLRLWALSLAHSQLSSVFFDRVLMMTITLHGGARIFAMIVGFFVWACATMGVLMIMESLSAFLHALRLHWVEYQNKFYKGDGYEFAPFNFASATKDEE